MADSQGDGDKRIRRLRKKLRQIEVLEYSNRQLNNEELLKVTKKDLLRTELSELVKAIESDIETEETEDGFTVLKAEDIIIKSVDTQEMKRRASENQDEHIPEKKKTHEPEADDDSNRQSQPSTSESRSRPEDNGGENNSLQVGNSEQDTEDRRNKNRIRKLRAGLEKSRWSVRELEGHEDLVLDCDIQDNLVVTASRDTTVKVGHFHALHKEVKTLSVNIAGLEHLDRKPCSEYEGPLGDCDRRPLPRLQHRGQTGQWRHRGGGGDGGVDRVRLQRAGVEGD